MRALLLAMGTRGDVQPMVALALGLKAAGHEATLAAAPDFGPWVTSFGVRFVPVGPPFQSSLTRAWTRFKELMRFLKDNLEAQFEAALVEEARQHDVVVGGGAVFSGPTLSEAAGVPYVY